MSSPNGTLEEIETGLLLEGIFRRYGLDFRQYAPASLQRRIRRAMQLENAPSLTALLAKVLHEPEAMDRLVAAISVDVTSMFRDPGFYLSLRRRVLPLLRDLPFLRIWHAGCASGEEVYSMSIVLKEEGLLEKTRLYGTDVNPALLDKAKSGIFPIASMAAFTEDYLRSGGTAPFSDYYTARFGNAILRKCLRKNIVWGEHNLVTDGSFNEFHLVVCRNVLIYFDSTLAQRTQQLLFDSLTPGGVLALGPKESLRFSPLATRFAELDERWRIYRRIDTETRGS